MWVYTENDKIYIISTTEDKTGQEGWQEIDATLAPPLLDENMVARYAIVDGQVVERSAEERQADFEASQQDERVTLEGLQQAIELLISGEVE